MEVRAVPEGQLAQVDHRDDGAHALRCGVPHVDDHADMAPVQNELSDCLELRGMPLDFIRQAVLVDHLDQGIR